MSASRDQQALCDHAREVGAQLCRQLEAARVATDDWSDGAATDVLARQALDECVGRLAATEIWGEANRLPSNELWQVAGEMLSVGDLQHHARMKPRGYAGDFEMLWKICSSETCSHPLGRAFDRYFQSLAAPEAVRQRTQLVADRVVESMRGSAANPFRIVSVGAGPAVDMERAAKQLTPAERERIHITLLDLDPDALEHARQRLGQLLAASCFQTRRENLFRLPRLQRLRESLAEADFISCTGLFDYLSDADAVAMLSCFWRSLRPGGRMLVFNFSPGNTSRAYMEWIGNWYLLYRDQQSLSQLVRDAVAKPAEIEIAAELSGASLYALCRKPM